MNLELTSEEGELLAAILDARLGEYSEQIASADDSSFRERLRQERETLERIREKVRPA